MSLCLFQKGGNDSYKRTEQDQDQNPFHNSLQFFSKHTFFVTEFFMHIHKHNEGETNWLNKLY